MADLTTEMGELRFTVEITRKDTGKVEVVELIGTIVPQTENEEE